MFENFQTENKLRPSFASLLLGTFPPMGRHEEDGCFCCFCGSKKHGRLPFCLKIFKQKTSCAPHSPRCCSAPSPGWEGMKRTAIFAVFAVAKSMGGCLIV